MCRDEADVGPGPSVMDELFVPDLLGSLYNAQDVLQIRLHVRR